MSINTELPVSKILINDIEIPLASSGSGGTETTEDWKPNPTWWDIKTILENDTRDYTYKLICLYTNSTVSDSIELVA